MAGTSASELKRLAVAALASVDKQEVTEATRALSLGYEAHRERLGEDDDKTLEVLGLLASLMEHAAHAQRGDQRETLYDRIASIWTHVSERRSVALGANHPLTADAGLRAAHTLCIELSEPGIALPLALRCRASIGSPQIDDESAFGALVLAACSLQRVGDVDAAADCRREIEARLASWLANADSSAASCFDRWSDALAQLGSNQLNEDLYRAAVSAAQASGELPGDAAVARAHRHARRRVTEGCYPEAVDVLLECLEWERAAEAVHISTTSRVVRDVVMTFVNDPHSMLGAWYSPDDAHPINIGMLVRQARELGKQCETGAVEEALQDATGRAGSGGPKGNSARSKLKTADNKIRYIHVAATSTQLYERGLRLLERALQLCRSDQRHAPLVGSCLTEYLNFVNTWYFHFYRSGTFDPESLERGRDREVIKNYFLSKPDVLDLGFSASVHLCCALWDLGHPGEALEIVEVLRSDTLEVRRSAVGDPALLFLRSFGSNVDPLALIRHSSPLN